MLMVKKNSRTLRAFIVILLILVLFFTKEQAKAENGKVEIELISKSNQNQNIRSIIIRNKGQSTAENITISIINLPLKIESNSCSTLAAGKECEISFVFIEKPNSSEIKPQIEIYYNSAIKEKNTFILSFHDVAKDVLNLSNYSVSNSDLELKNYCKNEKSDGDIYGNGRHNIPIIPKFIANDSENKEIPIDIKELLSTIDIQQNIGSNNYSLPEAKSFSEGDPTPEKAYFSGLKSSIQYKDDLYSTCLNFSHKGATKDAFYFKTLESGPDIRLGAKVKYIDTSGILKEVSTNENGKINIKLLSQIDYTGDFLKIIQDAAIGKSGFLSNGYSLIRVTRNESESTKWDALKEFTADYLTLTDTGWPGWESPTTGKVALQSLKKQVTIHFSEIKNRFEYGRNFDRINIFQKKNLTGDDQTTHNIDNWKFNLNNFLPNDIGIGVRSSANSGSSSSSAWIYSYTLELYGKDRYGNDFHFIGYGKYL